MLENDFSINPQTRALTVSIHCPNVEAYSCPSETKRSLNELQELLKTLHIPVLDSLIQNRKQIDSATILGKGKILEIKEKAKELGADLLVFDIELTSSQIRNIKKLTGLPVVDRCHVILEIFAKHAKTKEAKIQIEIARLEYILPRLAGFWSHLSRQRGGVGVRGGEGEKQIELDRRIIRNRITTLKREHKELEKTRIVQRKKRKQKAVTAALVGYTNAGKSSILNRLCRQEILEENKLFATLDATFRMLNPDTHPPMILIDTVGFLSNLPNTLIEGFKTTLESALEADLLVIVCDVSDPHVEKHLEVTFNVLDELGLEDKEKIIVFNKKDLCQDKFQPKIIKRAYTDSYLVSTYDKEDMNSLRKSIIDFFLSRQPHYDLFVPYEHGHIHSALKAKTNIVSENIHEEGIFYRVKAPDFIFNRLNVKEFTLGPNDPRLKNIQGF